MCICHFYYNSMYTEYYHYTTTVLSNSHQGGMTVVTKGIQ